MTNKWKQIAGLAVVLITLGALATWDEWQTKQDEKAKESKGQLTTDLKPDDIVSIHFVSRGDSEVGGDKTPQTKEGGSKPAENPVDARLVRKDEQWMLTSPVATAADNQVVSDLLKNILEYKSDTEVAQGKDQWATFGLTNPRRAIELESANGKKLSFFVGNNVPVGFNTYVATSASERVYSGSQYIATATLKSLFDIRNKKILALSSPEVSGVTISRGNEKLALEKADGRWALTSPVKAAADIVAVNNLLDDFGGLKATEFIESPTGELKKLLSSKQNLAKIEVRTSNQVILFRLLENKADLYIAIDGQPTIYKVAEDTKTKILKSAKDLRDKKIFTFQSPEVASVTVDGQAFKKVLNDWYTDTDAGKFGADGKFSGKSSEQPSPVSHIRGLLVDLEYARAEDVLDNASTLKLPKAPKHQITLDLQNGKTKVTIDAWQGTGSEAESFWVRASGSEKVYRVKKSVLASIAPQSASKPVGDEATAPSLSN